MSRDSFATPGIYEIRNMLNGKQYVGSSVNIRTRLGEHVNDLNKGKHHNARLQHAWNKYGAGAFAFDVLEVVGDVKNLIEREQCWLDALAPQYNLYLNARSRLGIPHSAETKARISAAKMNPSQETRDRISEANRNRSLEARARMSESHRGKILSEETKAKIAEANRQRGYEFYAEVGAKRRGHRHSPESIAKMRQVQAGKQISNEQREKLRAANLGKRHSEDTKAKMRAAHARRLNTHSNQEGIAA